MSNENATAAIVYCPLCGVKAKGAGEICPGCGKPLGEPAYRNVPLIGAGGMGYSDITDHETFAAYNKRKTKTLLVAFPIIALVITVGLLIMKTGLFLSIFGGLFILLLMLIIMPITNRKKPSWEGRLIKKSHQIIPRKDKADKTEYKMKFETDQGKKKVQVWTTYTPVYDYIQEGDRVRFLGNIRSPYAFEKYDKSNEEKINCVCCGQMMDPRCTYCTLCGAYLLKGKGLF